MKLFDRRRFPGTEFIEMHSDLCKACWKCLEICPSGALGKVDFFFHKHALIINPDLCVGCRRCLRSCEHKAIIPRNKQKL